MSTARAARAGTGLSEFLYGAHEGSPLWPQLKPAIAYYKEEWGFAERDAETLLLAKAFASLSPVDGTWLDLGSGPTGPLWLPIVRPRHAIFTDLHSPHIAVAAMRHGALTNGLPRWPVEEAALALAESIVGPATHAPWNCTADFVQQDITHLHRLPRPTATGKDDPRAHLVSMIGCLGGLPTRDALASALWHASGSLAPGGRLVVAMWLRDRPLDVAPAKYAQAPTLYSSSGISNGLSVDELTSQLGVYFRVDSVATLEQDELSPGALENNTARMVVVIATSKGA